MTDSTNPSSPAFAGPCARCGGPVPNELRCGEYPGALSRYDNVTFICSSCGVRESLMGGDVIPFDLDLGSRLAIDIRTELERHRPDLDGHVGCSCGWSITPAGDNSEYEQFRRHRADVVWEVRSASSATKYGYTSKKRDMR